MPAKSETVETTETTLTFDEAAIKEGLELLEQGATKAKIEGMGIFVHDMSVNEAKAFANEVYKRAGKTTSHGGTADWTDTVKYLRENYGKLPKKELINGMCEVNGKTYLSNQHAYNYIAMAIEWAKQECEASEE